MEDARHLGDVKICMIGGSGGGDVSFPITTDKGGTGNTAGYIRTGQKANTEMGENATAEGSDTESSGDHSHAEGDRTVASGYAAHAEGSQSTASGNYSHAESKSTASGEYSHAEGSSCVASGKYSHAGGNTATASGWGAFAHGEAVTAGYSHQTVVGHGNDNKSGTLFEVGNGTGLTLSDVSNAFEVYNDGKISCDNGASKFQFTQNSGVDGYYDASGTWHAFGSGGGSSIKKTRYTITASSWSASANSDGYYTYTVSLSPAVKSSPDVYVAGSTDSTQPTDAQRAQFGYVERCKVNGSTLTLYAKTKPTATFYVWVEGEEGTASGDIVGNVVKPNDGNTIPSMDEMPSFATDGTRFTREAGGWIVKDGRCYVDMIVKCIFSMTAMPYPLPDSNNSDKVYSSGIKSLPAAKGHIVNLLSCVTMKKNDNDNDYVFYSFGRAVINYNSVAASDLRTSLNIGTFHDVTAADDVYFHVSGSYEVA